MESADVESLTDILRQYISAVNARVLILRTLREHSIPSAEATRADLRKCSASLRRGIELFVGANSRDAALQDLARFCGGDNLAPDACSIKIESEADISTVRSEARRICDRAGAKPFAMQRVTTIVSELARNIILYAQRGMVEIIPIKNKEMRVLIRATDQGPGIPNLERVLSGSYKSKTGLGRGLLGSKLLADKFEVSTGSSGTQVTIEVRIS